MRFASSIGGLALALVVGGSLVLSGCGGGGSGGSGGGGGDGVLLLITAQGVASPLWQNVNGNPTPPPVCPDGVFVNSTITFTFDGAVSPTSLPQGGVAVGSINIVVASTGQGALGSFTVVDDPAFPAGNARRVIFSPTPPGNPNAQCQSGLFATQTYQISIPQGGASPQVLVINGSPIGNSATTCFMTCGCPNPGTCVSSFTDPVPGAPYVVLTSPATGDPAPPAVDPGQIVGNTIQILISEPLNPASINLANVRVVNSVTQAQVPGTLNFFQTGSLPGLTINSRIDYVASSPLLGSVTYQILFSPAVQDFGGNSIQTTQSNPAALLLFQTVPVTFCPQPAIDEQFTTVANKDLTTGELQWNGTGVLQSTFPLILTGTGADGPFNPAAGTIVLDTNEMISGQSRMGFWNFTTVNIGTTTTVRLVGPFQAHIRCTQTFNLLGTINADAAIGAFTSVNPYDRGPEQGISNNNGGLNCQANGGAGNAGGGFGGTGSGITPPPGSPPNFDCMTRVPAGENGFGPTIQGIANTGMPPNLLYGGGTGGDSGCFPAAGAGCTVGDLGGLGGSGGSAGRKGEDGLPRVSTAACTPTPNVIQMIAVAPPVPPAMIPPISIPSAGSGGGGGGDHWEVTGTPPNNDDQGAGAGGGGGGVRISCVGAFTMGPSVPASKISARGAAGQTAQAQGGGGGSGSGGEVWIQSFSTVTISATSIIDVTGPARFGIAIGSIGCSNQAAGGGGDGLVQIEAGVGPTPTPTFALTPAPTATTGAVFSAPTFQYAGGVTGQATSDFFYTGYGAPDYTNVIETFNLGNAAGATLTIRYEGAQEAVNSTAQNPTFDPATIKSQATGGGNITAANLSELDGYAFIRFIVNVAFPAPPTTSSSAVLPTVDRIQIFYNAALNCP